MSQSKDKTYVKKMNAPSEDIIKYENSGDSLCKINVRTDVCMTDACYTNASSLIKILTSYIHWYIARERLLMEHHSFQIID